MPLKLFKIDFINPFMIAKSIQENNQEIGLWTQ